MRIGSLFSGIGGLELGLEWAGLGETVWQCELDPFCRKVLSKHWPNVERFTDVTQPRVYPHAELICGGFPCQDVSSAGDGAGLKGQRSGLWYHYARVIEQVAPRVVVVENVASGKSRWLVQVRHALHVLGYRTRAFAIAARDVGAPHLRRRIFVVGYAHGKRKSSFAVHAEMARPSQPSADADQFDLWEQSGRRESERRTGAQVASIDGARPSSDARTERCEGTGDAHEPDRRPGRPPRDHWGSPQPSMVRVVHGLPKRVDPAGPRPRIRALGNAVVPQCAYVVGLRILDELAR